MKLTTTVSALILSALASSNGADALSRHGNSRRSLQLNENGAGSSSNLLKRVPLAQPEVQHVAPAGMQKMVKRQPLPAGFGSIPSMNDGTMPIVGVAKRQNDFGSHNGKQGSAVVSKNNVSVKKTSGNNASSTDSASSSDTTTSSSSSSDDADTSTTSTSDDADDDECEEDEDDDEDDCEEDEDDDADDCEEDEDDADDCEEDEDDDTDDCEDDEDDSTSSAASSSTEDATVAAATANVNVNLKQSSNSNSNDNNNNSGSSSKLSSNRQQQGQGSSSSSSSAAASKTSSATKSESTDSSSSSSGESYTGIATWFTQNGNAGACGKVNPDSAKVIALYTSLYGSGDNCGRTVTIENLDDGGTTTATVADMCPTCGGPDDIDLSVGAFEAIDPDYQTHGVRNIKWYFTD